MLHLRLCSQFILLPTISCVPAESRGVGMWLGIGMQALNVALDFILIAVLGQGV